MGAVAPATAANARHGVSHPASHWKETVLSSFDGQSLAGGLTIDGMGNLYGETSLGGKAGCGYEQEGCGTIFKLSPNGAMTTLYTFQGGSDGEHPTGALVADDQGNMYGTTADGGGSMNCGDYGCGTVFELEPNGQENVLYSFQGGSDGAFPETGVIIDGAGNIYGTTNEGGGPEEHGTVFKVTPNGQETVLYAFQAGNDGSLPSGGLVRDNNGNMYGLTAYGGGSSNCGFDEGCGTLFKIASDGAESIIHAFQNGADGGEPGGALALDGSGNLYGTASEYNDNTYGLVFQFAPDGAEKILHDFHGDKDGWGPNGVILDSHGNLFGTTAAGGSNVQCGREGCGTAFEVTFSGREKVLYRFEGKRGVRPLDAMLANGALYGTTELGGAHNGGVVFELLP
jgi:uncharacterized repeat protein (TIGR03803 family)